MNFQWFNSSEWANLVHALLHTLWEAVVMAVLLGLVLRKVRSPVARYRCALGAMVAVIFAGLVTWAVLNRPVTPSNSEHFATRAETAVKSGSGVPPLIPSAPALASSVSSELTTAENHWTAWLALLWLAGATAMIGRAAIQISGAEQLRRSARPLEDERIAALLAETRRAIGLTRRVQIAVTDRLTSPAVVGVIMPTLILPISLITSLTPDQIRFVLLHELAHIRRGDYFANLFQLLAEALLFFNPAVWWISRHIRIEREACCDALAVELSRAPAEYVRTLVRVAETILTPLPQPALAFGDRREPSSLADRVQRMLVPGYRPTLRLTWRAMAMALLVGGGLLFLSAIGTRIAVAAVLSPQQRMDRIERKMAEYGAKPTSHHSSDGGGESVTVTAHFRTEDGSPLPREGTVLIYSRQRQGSVSSGGPMARDGAFSMGMHPGEIWIEAEVAGYAPVVAGPFDGYSTNRVDAGELIFVHGFKTVIHVSDFASGTPISGATVHPQFINRESGNYLQPSANGISDQAGNMTLSNCIDQTLAVAVNTPGYEIIEQRFNKLSPDNVLEIKLRPGASVHGLVVDKNTGEGIAGAELHILYEKGENEGRYDWSDAVREVAKGDANGHFATSQFHRGAVYSVGVSAPDHESVIVEKVIPGGDGLIVKLGPELVVRGHVIGNLKGLLEVDRAPNLYCNTSEVIENNSRGYMQWVPIQVTNGVATFVFTNRMVGSVSLAGGGYEERRDVTAPIADWVVDLSQTKTNAAKVLPKREVVFRFAHPTGAAPRGTVQVLIPDNLETNHLTAHWAEMEISNSEARAEIVIGGATTVEPKRLVGYWFDRWGKHLDHMSIQVTNGIGPMVVKIPLVPAGAIFASARNADGTPAGDILFGLVELKKAPGRSESTALDSGGDGYSGGSTRKWVSGPLPLGGTYQVHTWRGNAFAVSKPVKLTEANPDAEVELQFVPGKAFDGIVLDADGKPLPDAQVGLNFTLTENRGFALSSLVTDEDGQFHFENATPDVGEYTAQANAPGFGAERVTLKFSSQPQAIHLKRGRSLGGRVIEAKTGYPIPGLRVSAMDLDKVKFPNQDTVTDADGRFSFSTLGDVKYTFYVQEAQPLTDRKYYPDGSTNLVLAVKLYEWSQIKAVPPASDAQAKLH